MIHIDTSETQYLKVHQKNGDVSVFVIWDYTENQDSILGYARTFDFTRKEIDKGRKAISKNEILLMETNDEDAVRKEQNNGLNALTVLSSFNAAIATICLIVKKACFGSCPTFYIEPYSDVHYSNAEGFSNAICPSLKQSDVDALGIRKSGGPMSIYLKNEALETHVIDMVELVAVPLGFGQKAYNNRDGHFFACENTISPSLLKGDTDLSLFMEIDEAEYFSLTDSFDLSAKEELEFTFFNGSQSDKGVVLNFRQSLVTTFLLYQALSYAGDQATDLLAQVELNSHKRKLLEKPFDLLSGIKVFVFDESNQKWKFVDYYYETGPIARNLQLLQLPDWCNQQDKIKLKLEMAKGSWRLDYIGLTDIAKQVVPKKLKPTAVYRNMHNQEEVVQALSEIDDDKLVTLPLDVYELQYDIPGCDNMNELFINSHGYYLEWMREDWMREKDMAKLRKMLMNDPEVWRELAINFKNQEEDMEEIFWSSKIEKVQ